MSVGCATAVCAFLLAVSLDPTLFLQCPADDFSSQSMISVQHNTADGSLSLRASTPVPTLRDGEMLIKVGAAGVNRLDLLQAVGRYPPPPGDSEVLGVEVSGCIQTLSDDLARQTGLKTGDCVMALVGGGGYAQFAAVPYQTVIKMPTGMSFAEAAGLMEIFLTAYQALTWNSHLKDNETILIHAGASGVGLAAIQLCKLLFKNITIITTAGSEEKVKVCREYGAHLAINYKEENFAEEVLSFTANKGADVILDFVGASYWENHTQCVAVDGRIVLLGLLGGAVTEKPLNMGVLLKKRVSLICSTLRARSLEYKHRLVQEFAQRCLPLLDDGGPLKVPVHKVYTLDEVSQAHDTMRANKNIGKLILDIHSFHL